MPIEYTIIISFVSVVCTVIGVSIGLGNLRRNSRIDDKHESTQLTRVEIQLEHIDKNVDKIVGVIDDIKKEIKEYRDRLVIVEYDTKQVKKEIAELASRRRGDISA